MTVPTTARPPREAPRLNRGRVLRTERLTPHMIRVVLGGDGPRWFAARPDTDQYVKLLFPVEGAAYPESFDMAAVRRDLPRDQWPRTRTYTVRSWDPAAAELSIDFVVHGDQGLAGPWAAAARPGDELLFLGPGGGYAPDPAADWHLLAGDESALPAIAAALAAMPPTAVVLAFVEGAGPVEEQKLAAPAGADIRWSHRGSGRHGDALVAAVTGAAFPPGTPQGFVHGEAHLVKELRRHLRHDRLVPRERLSISGYWRRGSDEDGWQAGKAEWNRQVEREQEAAADDGRATA
ncbi:siderophore-interacting protein [Streptomyces specialis]|uniref:siderophore-interacting protein n=1 Tax=Streptomyces specialis TaxID=498367 RepID=UPI00073F1804|nr:siderophore-interacting protein [Streptomyces specialis]